MSDDTKPRSITEDEIASWWTPKQAAEYAMEIVGRIGAKDAIWKRVTSGLIESAATFGSLEDPGQTVRPGSNPVIIRVAVWTVYSEPNSDFWGAGDATFFLRGRSAYDKPSVMRYFGIKLNPADVKRTLPGVPVVAISPPETAPANKGGAPRKEWWDDFWIAICGQIWEGDLKPKSQADLERAMLDWASAHSHDMSETSAKTAARKLYKAWKLGDKN